METWWNRVIDMVLRYIYLLSILSILLYEHDKYLSCHTLSFLQCPAKTCWIPLLPSLSGECLSPREISCGLKHCFSNKTVWNKSLIHMHHGFYVCPTMIIIGKITVYCSTSRECWPSPLPLLSKLHAVSPMFEILERAWRGWGLASCQLETDQSGSSFFLSAAAAAYLSSICWIFFCPFSSPSSWLPLLVASQKPSIAVDAQNWERSEMWRTMLCLDGLFVLFSSQR